MLNLSDKELDRLSREAAEQFEPDDEISSWEKLEQQLSREIEDQPPATPTRFTARPVGYGLVLLLLVGASYYLLKSGNHSKSSTLQNKEVITEANKPAASAPANSSSSSQPANHSDVSDKNTSSSGATDDKTNSNKEGTNNKSTVGSATNDVSKDAGRVASDKSGATVKNGRGNADNQNAAIGAGKQKNEVDDINKLNGTNKSSNKISVSQKDVVAKAGVITAGGVALKNNGIRTSKPNSTIQNTESVNDVSGQVDSKNSSSVPPGISQSNNQIASGQQAESPKYAALPGIAFNGISSDGISDSSLRKIRLTADSAATQPQKNQALHINRSLKIGLMVGPDITMVHSTNGGRFSGNVGLTIGYQFADRFSINTGLIYTKKNYASQGEDFHPKNWPPNVTNNIEFVSGYCSMWEIPLSLRYDIPMGDKFTFFVNGGLSSYLMNNESYEIYTRAWGGYPRGVREYPKTKSDQKYWFSIAALSVGIEHQFSKSFSLQAEPFVKIPFSGVGLGNLQLNSYGVSFSLRYSPVLSRKRK